MSVDLLNSIADSYEHFEAIFAGNKTPDLFRTFKDIVGSCTDETKACVCLRLFNLCSIEAPEALLQFNDFLPAEYAFIEKERNKSTDKPLVILSQALEEHSRTCPNDHGATPPHEAGEDGNMLMHAIEQLLPAKSSLEFKHLIIAFSSQQVEAIEFIMYSAYLMKNYPELLTCLMFYLTPSWKKFSYTSLNIVPLERMGSYYGLPQNMTDDKYMHAILSFVSNPSYLSKEALEWRASVIHSIGHSLSGMMAKSPKLFDHTQAVVLNLMDDSQIKDMYLNSDDSGGLQHRGQHQHQYPYQYQGHGIEQGLTYPHGSGNGNGSGIGIGVGVGGSVNGSGAGSMRGALGKSSARDKGQKMYKIRSGYGQRHAENWSIGRNTISIMRSILAYDGGFGADFKNLSELSHHTEQYFTNLLSLKETPRHAVLSQRIPCCKLLLISACEGMLSSNFVPLMRDSYAALNMQRYDLSYSFFDREVLASSFDAERVLEMDKVKYELSIDVNAEYFERRLRYVKQLQAFMKRYVTLPALHQYLLITRRHNEVLTFIENACFCQLKYNLYVPFSLAVFNEQNDSRSLSHLWQLSAASYIKANTRVNYPCRVIADDAYLVYMQLVQALYVREIVDSYPSMSLKNYKGLLAQYINEEILRQYAPYVDRKILNMRDVYEIFLFFSNEKNFDAILQGSQSWTSATGYNFLYSGGGNGSMNHTAQSIHVNNIANIQHTAQLAEGIESGFISSYSQWLSQTGEIVLPLDIPVMSVSTEHDLTVFEMRLNRPSMEERSRISAVNIPENESSYRFKHPVRTSRPDSVLNKYYYGIFPMGSESSAKSIRQMNVSQLIEDNRKIVQNTDDIAGLEEELIKYDVFIYNLKLVEKQLQVFCSRNCPNLLRVEFSRNGDGGNDTNGKSGGYDGDIIFEGISRRNFAISDVSGDEADNEGVLDPLDDSLLDQEIASMTANELTSKESDDIEPCIKRQVVLVQGKNALASVETADADAAADTTGAAALHTSMHSTLSQDIAGDALLAGNTDSEAVTKGDDCNSTTENMDQMIAIKAECTDDTGEQKLRATQGSSMGTVRSRQATSKASINQAETSNSNTNTSNFTTSGFSRSLKGKILTTNIQSEVTKDLELGRAACLDLPLPCLETIKSVIGNDYYDLFLRHPKTSAPFVLKRLRVFLRDLQNHRNFNQSPLIVKKLRMCSLRNLDHLSNGQTEIDKKAFIIRNMFTDFEVKQQNSFYLSDALFDSGHYNGATSEFILDPQDDGSAITREAKAKFQEYLMAINDSYQAATRFWYDEEQCPEERFKTQKNVTYEQIIAVLINQNFPGCYCSCTDRLSSAEETPLSDNALVLLNKLKIILDALFAQLRQRPGFCTKPAQHKCYFLPHVMFNIRHFKPEVLQFLRLWLLSSQLDPASYAAHNSGSVIATGSDAVTEDLQEVFFEAVFGQMLYADLNPSVDESQSVCIIEFMTYILLRFAYSVLTRLSMARQICEEAYPGVTAETLQLEVIRKFGLVDPFDVTRPSNSYEYSFLCMNLMNAFPGNIANCAEIDQTPTQSLTLYFSEKEISRAVEAAMLTQPVAAPTPIIQSEQTDTSTINKSACTKAPRTDLYWLIVQWYILSDKISQEQFEFDMSALLGSSIAVIFNLKTIMKTMRKIYNEIFSMYVEVHHIYETDGAFKSTMIDASTISALLLYIQKTLKVDMLAEHSGELRSRLLLCDVSNKRGSGIILSEVVAGCMCFTELFDVKPMP